MPFFDSKKHFTILNKPTEILSCHISNELLPAESGMRFGERFAVNLKEIEEKLKTIDFNSFLSEYEIHQVPGRLFVGGLMHSLTKMNFPDEKMFVDLENIANNIFVSDKKSLNCFDDKIWIVYDRRGSANGIWFDIGMLFGPHNGNCWYLPYNIFNMIIKNLLDGMLDIPSRNIFNVFRKDSEKEALFKKGKKIFENRRRKNS